MDTNRFDSLTRRLSKKTSRRGSLALLTGVTAFSARLVAVEGKGSKKRRRRRKDDQAPTETVVCRDGQSILIPIAEVEASLGRGDTLGPCDILESSGAATCVPLDQVCNPYSPNRCCGATLFNGTGCFPTAYPYLSVCQVPCKTTPECQSITGSVDVECVRDWGVCPIDICCRPKVCKIGTDCKGGGPCCFTLTGQRRCCAPGQVCATFGGCANP